MPEGTVTLSIPEWDYIMQVLQHRPYAEVVGLISKIQAQLSTKETQYG